MKILNLIQGTPEWKEHRATAFNASDAPAMLGISKYETRTQLIHRMATGIVPEVDDATQRRFNDGHRFEVLARPLAEKIIGDELSPVTGTNGRLSASFDGLPFDNSIPFEHKSLNQELREVLSCEDATGADLEMQYQVQMEQQLMVCGGKKTLFMASTWNEGSELVEELHCWYYQNPELAERIDAGWVQLEKDVEEYKRKLAAGEIEQPKSAPKAEAIQALPAVFVQATGMVTASNLSEFKEAATTFIAAIKTELVCDQDFADAEATVKFCKEAEGNLESTKASVLAQMSTVDEVVRALDHIAAQLRNKRLMLDKLVKSEKEARKLEIISKAGNDFTAHVQALESETRPIKLNVARPDFSGAIKGLKSLSSMQEKVDTALRDGKFTADQLAADVRKKLAWCKDNAAGHGSLFPDLQSLMVKPMEDFTLTITSRIDKYRADEAEKMEAVRVQAEADARAKIEKEQREANADKPIEPSPRTTSDKPSAPAVWPFPMKDSANANPIKPARPSDEVLITSIASSFGITYGDACDWVMEAAERMIQAA